MRHQRMGTLCASFLMAAGAIGVLAVGEEASRPKLSQTFLPDSIRFVAATSEDLQSGVLIFDNFMLATTAGKGEPANARTKTFTFTNPTEAKDAASVAFEIRGFVSVQEGGSASLMIHAGGETTVIDLSKASAAGASKVRAEDDELYGMAAASAESAEFAKATRPKSGQDFYAKVTASLAKGAPLQATVILLVDRVAAASSQAMVAVESIDISIKAAPVSKSMAAAEKKTEKPTAAKTSTKKSTADTAIAENTDAKDDEDAPPSKRKATVSKASASKTVSSKTTAGQTTAEKAPVSKAAAEKATAEKAPVSKATAEKATPGKATAEKAAASKATVSKAQNKETKTSEEKVSAAKKDTDSKPASKAAGKKETKPASEDAEPVTTSSKKAVEKKTASKKSE